jgi:hypothetical protein
MDGYSSFPPVYGKQVTDCFGYTVANPNAYRYTHRDRDSNPDVHSAAHLDRMCKEVRLADLLGSTRRYVVFVGLGHRLICSRTDVGKLSG